MRLRFLILATALFFLIELKFFRQSFGSFSAAITLVMCQIFSVGLPFSIWLITEKRFMRNKYKFLFILILIIVSFSGILLVNTSSPIF